MDPIVEMQLPYEFVSFICQSPRPSLDEYRIVVKDMLIYHLGESPEHLEEQGVAVIDALDPSGDQKSIDFLVQWNQDDEGLLYRYELYSVSFEVIYGYLGTEPLGPFWLRRNEYFFTLIQTYRSVLHFDFYGLLLKHSGLELKKPQIPFVSKIA